MKKELRRLFDDFPNLIELLKQMRECEEKSYQSISNIFNDMGYKCSRTMIQRVYKKYDIDIKRNRKGKNNSFYGKRHSDKTKECISRQRIEKGIARGKNNPMYGTSGILSPNWKGGTSSKQAIFYSSIEWKEKRNEIMELDNFTCLKCGFYPHKEHNYLNVHHIIPLSLDWEQRLVNNNLITLCIDCHKDTFGNEIKTIHLFQDIVRTHRRL